MPRTFDAVQRTALAMLLLGSGCGDDGAGEGKNVGDGGAGDGDSQGHSDAAAGDGDTGGDGDSQGDGDSAGNGDSQGDGADCQLNPNAVPTWRVLDIPLEGLGVADINQQGAVAKGFTGVAYGNGVWVASVNSQGEDVIRWARSTDGEHWEAHSAPVPAGTTYTTSRIHFALGKFVYFGELKDQGSFAFTSTDGKDFTITKIGDGRLVLDQFAFSDSLVVIAGHDMDMRISTDLVHWTGTGIGAGIYSYLDVAYGDGRFVTSINGAGHVYTSVDGVTWDTVAGLQSSRGYGLEYGNGFWLVSGGGGSYWKSTNGVDFATVAVASGEGGNAPTFAGDRFVSVGMAYSSGAYPDKFVASATRDGENWSAFGETMVPLPADLVNVRYSIGEVAYGDCKYVIAGNYVPATPGATEQEGLRQPVKPLIIMGDVSGK